MFIKILNIATVSEPKILLKDYAPILAPIYFVSFTFGVGGALNLGVAGTINTNPQPASTDFSAGGVLPLAAGDSITFGSGAYLILGSQGNIDYTNMTIDTSGGARLVANELLDIIVIKTLRITGGGSITFDAGFGIAIGAQRYTSISLIRNDYALSRCTI